MTFRVLVSDKLSEKGLAVFHDAGPDIEVDDRAGLGKNREALLAIIGDYDGLAVRSGTEVDAELIAKATKLKVVGRAGIGVDNIDLAAASQRGIVVMNTPEGNVVTTAEHAISLMCALTRKIPQATASMRAGKWEKTKFEGRELFEKTLGVIGLGNIGKIVADRARGLRMKVLAHDPYVTKERARELGVVLADLDEILRRSDVITLHVPLLDSTRNIIDAGAIEKMKPGALLVNAARGGLVDESAVASAVASGRLGGAAFDVFVEEPPSADCPLLGVENIIVTPHLGASTSEAQENVAVAVAHQIVEFLTAGTVKNAINAPSVPSELLELIGPYIELGRKLGRFAAELHTGSVQKLRFMFGGEAAEQRTDPISIAILRGILATRLGTTVNDINAPLIAKERGIEQVEEKTTTVHDFVATVGVRIEGDGGNTTEVIGAIFGHREPRIVSVDGMRLEIVPEGQLLLTKHHDRPGIIGKVGTVLGTGDVNISRMVLGLGADFARAAISIDSKAPAEVIDQMKAIDGIEDVRPIDLG